MWNISKMELSWKVISCKKVQTLHFWETMWHHIRDDEDTSECFNPPSEFHSCLKSHNRTWLDTSPHPPTQTFTCLFSASTLVSLYCPPTAPPPYLAAKPEPVNSWGRVLFDKWHQTPGSLPSCCHKVVPSVWTRTMWSDPTTPPPPEISGHNLHSKKQSSILSLNADDAIQISICAKFLVAEAFWVIFVGSNWDSVVNDFLQRESARGCDVN